MKFNINDRVKLVKPDSRMATIINEEGVVIGTEMGEVQVKFDKDELNYSKWGNLVYISFFPQSLIKI